MVSALIMLGCCAVSAEDGSEAAGELIDSYSELYGSRIEDAAGGIIESAVPYAQGFNLPELISRAASGEFPLDVQGVYRELLNALFGKLRESMKKMTAAAAVVLLSSLLTPLTEGFAGGGASRAARYICFITVAGLTSSVFYDCIEDASGAIENLSVFMRCIIPVMLMSLLASGAIVSASALEPALIGIIELSVSLIKNLFMPLAMISAGLGIVNALSESLKTARLIKFINNFVKYGLSVLLTVFVAFAGLRSITASGADALTLKLTKFASSNLIPIVGGILSDSVDTVMRCSALIKNSVGIVGVILVFFIAVMPVLDIIATLTVLRLTAAFCEPIADKSLVECVSAAGDGVSMSCSMLVAVSVMFIMIITVMINISV